MTKYQRAKRKIERDKEQKKEKNKRLYAEYDDFDKLITMQHLCESLKKCRKGVSWKYSVQRFTQHGIIELYNIYRAFHSGKLPTFASLRRITLYERGKKREIVPIVIHDRVPQRTICDYSLVPVLKNKLIYDNGASMKDKGVDFARKRLMHQLRKSIKEYGTTFYVLVFDFKSFFDSIPHSLCLDVMKKNFHDKYIQGATMAIIKSYEKAMIESSKDDPEKEEKLNKLRNNLLKGICLGSQVSQIMALAAPNELDHFIKDQRGVKYVHYMDDGVIFSDSKDFLRTLLTEMEEICNRNGLNFNKKKTRIVKISRGFVFLKMHYKVTNTGKIVKTLTRDGIVRTRRKLKNFRWLVNEGNMTLDDVYNSMQSRMAHTSTALSYHTQKNTLKLYNQLFDGYRITKKWEHVKGGENGELLQTDKWRDFRWDCVAA